jgi:hypothetical protein
VSEGARVEIGQACADAVLTPAIIMPLATLPEVMLAHPTGPGGPITLIARDCLSDALTGDFQSRATAALVDGFLSWQSPVDGTNQPSSGGFCFNHFAFAYRLQDRDSGLVSFLLVSEHKARLLGLYIPSEALIVIRDEGSRRAVELAFPNLSTMVVDYVCKLGGTLLPYLTRKQPKRLAASMRENHLGHQIWNELGGLEAIATRIPREQLPPVFPLGGPSNAFLGPFEAILPEFAGRIRYDLGHERNIIEYANHHDLSLVRFTADFVSTGLRGRIVHQVKQTDEFRAVAARRRLHSGPVVLIGLRVENRTAVDLVGFVSRLITYVAGVLPGAMIVLDGQNSNDPATGRQATTSFLSYRAARSLVTIEAEICQEIVTAVGASVPFLEVASGKPLATSIAWGEFADCVISFWGAGLAKYRWIANKPTLAISNRDNLLNRGDLLIYSLPRYMEDPSPTQFVDPLAIHDEPDAPRAVPLDGLSFTNFRIDEDIFFPQVREFLDIFGKR